MITEQELDEIQALAERATAGGVLTTSEIRARNDEFLGQAPRHLVALVAEVRRLRSDVVETKEQEYATRGQIHEAERIVTQALNGHPEAREAFDLLMRKLVRVRRDVVDLRRGLESLGVTVKEI